ncbi:hypothetical protein [Caldiplasma sukawensis]
MEDQNPCLAILSKAENLASKSVHDFQSMDILVRKRLFNELEADLAAISVVCSSLRDKELIKIGKGNLKYIQIKIAQSLKGEKDRDSERIVNSFKQEEYNALEKIEKFSMLDNVNKNDIKIFLSNRPKEIINFITQWYGENMENFIDLLNPLKDDVRIELKESFTEIYKRRYNVIIEALKAYIDTDPGAFGQFIKNYESALREMEKTVDRYTKVINESELFTSSDLLMEISMKMNVVKNSLEVGNYEALKSMDLEKLKRDLMESGRKCDEMIREGETIIAELEGESTFSKNPKLRDVYVKNTRNMMERLNEIKIRDIMANYEFLSSIQDTLMNSADFGEIKLPENRISLSHSEMVARKNAFFESFKKNLAFMDKLKIIHPWTNETVNMQSNIVINGRIADLTEMAYDAGNGTNIFVLYTNFGKKKFFGSTISRIILAAFFVVKIDQKTGKYFLEKCDMSQIQKIIGKAMQLSDDFNGYVIAMIGSPNGFSARVIEYVTDRDGKGFNSLKISIILKDTSDGSVYFREKDEISRKFLEIFESGLIESRYSSIENKTVEKGTISGVVRLKDIISEMNYSEQEILETWKKMEKARKGSLEFYNGELIFRLSGQ